ARVRVLPLRRVRPGIPVRGLQVRLREPGRVPRDRLGAGARVAFPVLDLATVARPLGPVLFLMSLTPVRGLMGRPWGSRMAPAQTCPRGGAVTRVLSRPGAAGLIRGVRSGCSDRWDGLSHPKGRTGEAV